MGEPFKLPLLQGFRGKFWLAVFRYMLGKGKAMLLVRALKKNPSCDAALLTKAKDL